MTRWTVLTVVAGGVVWSNFGGLRWYGVALLGLLVLAVAWRFAAWQRRIAVRRTIEGLRALHPDDFEAEVAGWLRRDGWSVEHRGGTGDGGIDIIARKKKELLAVQCKRYAESAAVSSTQVRDLYGAAVASGSTGALMVTTGRVSRAAEAWCAALPEGVAMRLLDFEATGELASGRTRL